MSETASSSLNTTPLLGSNIISSPTGSYLSFLNDQGERIPASFDRKKTFLQKVKAELVCKGKFFNCFKVPYDPDTKACGYCNGTGTVERGELTSLIPVPASDARLRPRRTKWLISTSVFITLLLGLISAYFVYPRNIIISDPGMVQWIHAYIPYDVYKDRKGVNLTFATSITLKNDNYKSVYVNDLGISVYYYKIIAGIDILNDTLVIPARSQKTINITVNADSFNHLYEETIRNNCINFPQTDKFDFKINCTVHNFLQDQVLTSSLTQYVKCRNSSI